MILPCRHMRIQLRCHSLQKVLGKYMDLDGKNYNKSKNPFFFIPSPSLPHPALLLPPPRPPEATPLHFLYPGSISIFSFTKASTSSHPEWDIVIGAVASPYQPLHATISSLHFSSSAASFRVHPPALVWGPLWAAVWSSALVWSTHSLQGHLCWVPGAPPTPSLPPPPPALLLLSVQGRSSHRTPHHLLPCWCLPSLPQAAPKARHRHLGCGAWPCPVVRLLGSAGSNTGQPWHHLTHAVATRILLLPGDLHSIHLVKFFGDFLIIHPFDIFFTLSPMYFL